ncbi:substrate-binding domain-containing protein [Sphaerisporangium sp. NPDC088356]|uniref:substrate-binding domain-containing protein n=1 Tax=Sphaerisporangium sp. NPDC088356 TaxID=3154871 RepID=UPI00341D22B4
MARAAGVSTATVSLVLNGRGAIGKATRDRVKRVAAELAYRPSIRAQRLRTGRSGSIAVITTIPDTVVGGSSRLGYLLDIAIAVAGSALKRGYSMVLTPPMADVSELDALDIDGAILLDPVENDPFAARLAGRGVRIVTIGDVEGVQSVGTVDRGVAGADVLIEHLIAQGCIHLLLISSIERTAVATSVRAYAAAREARGDMRLTTLELPLRDAEQEAYRVVSGMLARGTDVDAVYAPIDLFAVGAGRALCEAGRRIPEDVRLVTHYNGLRAQTFEPPITALDLHLDRMAELAVMLLLDSLEGRADRTVLPAPRPDVIVRGSTRTVVG